MARLPGLSDFAPGVIHVPADRTTSISRRDPHHLSASSDGGQHSQQQEQKQPAAAVSSGAPGPHSWAAEVCLRSKQELSGRVSVSSWLDDDEAAGQDTPCAFAVPPPAGSSVMSVSESEASSADGQDEDEDTAPAAATRGERGGVSHTSAGSTCSSNGGSNCSGGSSGSTSGAPRSCEGGSASGAGAAVSGSGDSWLGLDAAPADDAAWDTSLHLPLWVSAGEAAAIEARVDGWVERLLEVGADVRSLAGA